MVRGYVNSKTDESDRDLWRTPLSLYATLHREFQFTCDVAASDDNHLAETYINAEMDALDPATLWGLVNFCNPPYSNPAAWIDRAILESKNGKTTVMLVPADTSTKWFKTAFKAASEIRFVSGRISFIQHSSGEKGAGNNKGSVIFVFRAFYSGSRSVSLIGRESLIE